MERLRRFVVTAIVAAVGITLVPAGPASAADFFSATGALQAGDSTLTTRLFRDDPPSTCAAPTAGATSGVGPFFYDIYTLENGTNDPACVTVRVDAMTCTGPFIHSGAYVGAFDPANILTNFAADVGLSPDAATSPKSYSFSVPAGADFSVIVTTVTSGAGGACPGYGLTLSTDNPFATGSPSISGTPEANKLQISTPGDWNGSPTLTTQWRRCDSSGGACSDIEGATNSVYLATKADAGLTLRVRVTATEGGRTSSADSAQTAVIAADTQPPQAPTLAGTDPPSGSNDNAPRVKANGVEGRTEVRLFATADCAGPVVASGTPQQLIGDGIPVQVPDNSTTQISASLIDDFDNVSPCSNAISYTEVTPDTTAPETTITAAKKKIKTKKRRAKARFEFSSDEAGATFECRLDSKPVFTCTSPVTLKVKKGKHTFTVLAKDPAGNPDPTPAEFAFKVKRKRRR